jgi:putative glutathione S-transferase
VIVRLLKGLEHAVTISAVDPIRDERGWRFTEGPGHGPDPVNGFAYLREAYLASDPAHDGRVTVPVLWDRESGRIVNNESAEIIRMLNSEFAAWDDRDVDLYPAPLREEIDAVNEPVYAYVNDGVYKVGFARTQEAYEAAFGRLFTTLDWLDERLADRRWLVGGRITEADWRLFCTLVRFDAVYVGHFKCNLRRIADYRHLSGYLRDLYQQPGIAGTVDMDHIKRHYYGTHPSIDPLGIVPLGPQLDLDAPPGREGLGG